MTPWSLSRLGDHKEASKGPAGVSVQLKIKTLKKLLAKATVQYLQGMSPGISVLQVCSWASMHQMHVSRDFSCMLLVCVPTPPAITSLTCCLGLLTICVMADVGIDLVWDCQTLQHALVCSEASS